MFPYPQPERKHKKAVPPMFAKSLIGLTEVEACKKIQDSGYKWEILQRNGKIGTATADIRHDRLRLGIEDGVVIFAKVD